MNSIEAFTDWFNSLGFRHFSAGEFTSYFVARRKGIRNSVPSRILWKNLVPTLRIVDDLREHLGRPCHILSSFRSPDYNKTVGGAPLSQHLKFNALDITFPGVSPVRVHAILRMWRDQGKFTGGLGLYRKSGFVHIDTRGNNADWQGS
ncbi:MAG: DUF882 domain-containing protein [Akkermansiaceae bacterium]|nr:DUF882 domain-containing protein [Akkermansiaceae bacterium]MCF7734276.1 DUF882 domain-containing protein [Akkermansiaceae bacterium]